MGWPRRRRESDGALRIVRAAALWCACVLALGPSMALAARPRALVWAVPLDPSSEPFALRLQYLAELAVERSGRFTLLRLHDALDPDGAQERTKRAEEGRAAAEKGRKAYDALDTEAALRSFQVAVEAYGQ